MKALVLQAEINAILDAAENEPGDVRQAMGAINWGDLGCTEIEERFSLLRPGEFCIVAIVEEASPDATGLKAYILERLPSYPNLAIETEW